ncbi:MAG: winged helix-turn-helix transcriptional regulator [Spirochaetales bacterium]|nr:winged helix-turn-helix transcriptional regulator [Spirochaetales bacterium]
MMNENDKKRCELRAHMFKALAHPVRIFFLEKLKEDSWCVCKLAEEAGIPKSAASKHLSQLKEAGLVDDEKKGTMVEYCLTAPCVLEMASCAEGAVLANRRKNLGL